MPLRLDCLLTGDNFSQCNFEIIDQYDVVAGHVGVIVCYSFDENLPAISGPFKQTPLRSIGRTDSDRPTRQSSFATVATNRESSESFLSFFFPVKKNRNLIDLVSEEEEENVVAIFSQERFVSSVKNDQRGDDVMTLPPTPLSC